MPKQKHVNAYNRMLEHIKDFIDEAEDEFSPKVKYGVDSAKEKIHALGELTREETEAIASYIKRDLHDAAEYLSTEGKEFADWFRFDVDQLEARFADLLSAVVDTTKIEYQALSERAEKENIWMADEVAAPGTLICLKCGHHIQTQETSIIKTCQQCGHNQFQRQAP
jgi:rubrerythrin